MERERQSPDEDDENTIRNRITRATKNTASAASVCRKIVYGPTSLRTTDGGTAIAIRFTLSRLPCEAHSRYPCRSNSSTEWGAIAPTPSSVRLSRSSVIRLPAQMVLELNVAMRFTTDAACGGAGVVGLSLIHISEPTRRTPISYAVFCLKKKKNMH